MRRLHLKLQSSLHLDTEYLLRCPLCIAGLENIYTSEHFLNQSVKVLPQISEPTIWFPSKKFELIEDEVNLKDLLYLVLLD